MLKWEHYRTPLYRGFLNNNKHESQLNCYMFCIQFVWIRDKRPDMEIMVDNEFAITLNAGEKYEFTLKTLGNHQDQIHYIGVSVDTVKF